MYAHLPRLELAFYILYFSIPFSMMTYEFYKYCRLLENFQPFVDWALVPGWLGGYKYRENLDGETIVMTTLGKSYLIAAGTHILVHRLLFDVIISKHVQWRTTALLGYYTIGGFCGMVYVLGSHLSLFFVVLVVTNRIFLEYIFNIFPLIKTLSPLSKAWIIAIAQTVGFHRYNDVISDYTVSHAIHSAFVWSLGWYQLRLVSFTDSKAANANTWLHFLGYVFYFPIFLAPFQSYSRFLAFHRIPHNDDDADEKIREKAVKVFGNSPVAIFIKQFFYIMMWLFIAICINHMFFPVAMTWYQAAYKHADIWVQGGHSWMTGQWFQAKYMVLYGVPWLVVMLDTGLPLSPIPIFVSRIYRYSVMWRKFDTGLYEFMRDHLYGPALSAVDTVLSVIPLLNKTNLPSNSIFRKILALGLTYAFVGIWHGLQSGVLIFAAINYCYLLMEFAVTGISHKYQLAKKLSPLWYRRLTAFLCTFGVKISWIGFFFFMSNREQGWFWVSTLLSVPAYQYLFGTGAIYSWVQLSMELERLLDEAPHSKSVVEKPNDYEGTNAAQTTTLAQKKRN